MARIEISVMPPLAASSSIGATSWQNIMRFAQMADESGFNAILLQDHIGIPETETYDCFVTLGAIAALTKKTRVGTLATPLPLRHPALVAKAMATVDQISGGRAFLTVGAGWIQDDFRWYGLKYERFKTRVRMMREGTKVIKELWTKSPADFNGEFYRLEKACLEPKTIQKPYPPIWIAGVSDEALRVAVEEGNGWFGWKGITPEEFAKRVETVDRLCKERGRPRSEIGNGMHLQASIALDEGSLKKQAGIWMHSRERKDHHDMISCGTPEYFVDLLEEYAEAGANHINVVFVPVNKAPDQLEIFAQKVFSHFR
jgi:probable F420-dependent oxidoreductase